jgi:hypothetical protein
VFGVITASKCKQHEHVDEEELDDVDNHSAERDLQRPQMGVNAEDMHQLEKAANSTGVPLRLMFLSRAHAQRNDVYLNIMAAENIPSDNSMGSKGCHCSRGYHGSQPSQYSLCKWYIHSLFSVSISALRCNTDYTGMLPLRFIDSDSAATFINSLNVIGVCG